MVASVLVAAPAAAADPKADYTAKFDACLGAATGDAGFTDVPDGHANAGDIDCIAYYGITKGTSATTYSPLMSVSREHMALFLTRLAKLVGIEMAMDSMDTGFTDIGDLSAESQMAIGQLKDLGITQGTSDTTYSPADPVKRSHMALFIQRLMDKMNPISDGSTPHGNIPKDVKETDDKKVASPFTDLGGATKDAYDAITQLWELGVASGISDTSYGPSSNITRAAMAGFMAGVLDHSNARPAGLSIQTDKASGFGSVESIVLVSYRSDSFAPMEAMSVDIFNSTRSNKGLNYDGTCHIPTDTTAGPDECTQDSNDEQTDAMGNIYVESTTASGATNVWYAWTGESGDKFDADTVDEVTTTIVSSPAESQLKVTSTQNDKATNGNVDLDVTKSVTFTVQIQDEEGKNVARSDVDVSVTVVETGGRASTNTHKIKTDDDGKITYTVMAPTDTDETDDRSDALTFSIADGTEDDQTATVAWVETDPVLSSAAVAANVPYATRNTEGNVTVGAVVTLYDQYGNLMKTPGQTVTVTIDGDTSGARAGSSGRARWSRPNFAKTAGDSIALSATVADVASTTFDESTISPAGDTVTVVNIAADDVPVTTVGTVSAVHDKRNKFVVNNTLYTYDSDDVFILGTATENKSLTLDEFETAIGKGIDTSGGGTQAQLLIPRYDDDGSSTFVVTTKAAGA